MKTVYTCCVFSFVVLLMIGCAKEETPQTSTTNTTYNGGGGGTQNSNNSGSNTNSSNNTTKPNNGGTNQLPQNHPVGSAAACGGCHNGFVTVPDWAIDGIAKEEEDMLKADAVNKVASIKAD